MQNVVCTFTGPQLTIFKLPSPTEGEVNLNKLAPETRSENYDTLMLHLTLLPGLGSGSECVA